MEFELSKATPGDLQRRFVLADTAPYHGDDSKTHEFFFTLDQTRMGLVNCMIDTDERKILALPVFEWEK